jgi:hypothetical protein
MVQEILAAHNIRTQVAPLGADLAGMVYYSKRGHYYIIGNWILEFEAQQFVFLQKKTINKWKIIDGNGLVSATVFRNKKSRNSLRDLDFPLEPTTGIILKS